ncbi:MULTISPECIES: rod shape-determining protein MreD [Arenibacter]|uniref:rod shape-determining protein MreD n=1 Tax=Arenibacter TaxID=178469 RepID=UPI000A3C4580|nr:MULTISPECIES: rod shape-determining protein MreD [Arenibacter]
MISNNALFIVIRFLLLIIVQVLVFNNLNYFGYINPMVYLLFLYWYPINDQRAFFILWSFLLGLMVDWFSDTMAIHAAATVTIAYLRPAIMRFCFGSNLEFQNFRISSTTQAQQIVFLTLLIFIHHLIFFSLEIFSLGNTLLILKKVLFTGLATLVISLLLRTLFSIKKR